MKFIDTHCHIDHSSFDLDRGHVLSHCKQLGIQALVVPAVSTQGWHKLLRLCREHVALLPALGLHPLYSEQHRHEDLHLLEKQVEQSQPIAIGEIGLDFYHKTANREKQLLLFQAQLSIAKNAGLPVLLHSRKAHDQVLRMLKSLKLCGGIAHAFNGSLQQAQQYIDLGFKLGFGGRLTYAHSSKLHALAQALPLDSIVLETDAPDMPVSQHQGERNSPEYLPLCLHALAKIRRDSPQHIAKLTTNNACEVLRLPTSLGVK